MDNNERKEAIQRAIDVIEDNGRKLGIADEYEPFVESGAKDALKASTDASWSQDYKRWYVSPEQFLIGVESMLACLATSVLYMLRFFTRVPAWDRYQHGYRIRSGVWNPIVTLPLAVVGWLAISGATTVSLSLAGGAVSPSTILFGMFLLLPPICGHLWTPSSG